MTEGTDTTKSKLSRASSDSGSSDHSGSDHSISDSGDPSASSCSTAIEQIARSEKDAVTKWKIAVYTALLLTSTLVVVATYVFLSTEEKDEFETAFVHLGGTLTISAHFHARNVIDNFKSISDTITSLALASDTAWPFVKIPNAEIRFAHIRNESFTEFVGFSPLVEARDRERWEVFSVKNQGWVRESREVASANYSDVEELIPERIHIIQNQQSIEEKSWGPFAPMWYMSPPPFNVSIVNHNLLSDPVYSHLLQVAALSDYCVLTGVMDVTKFFDHVLDPIQHNKLHSKNHFDKALTAVDHPHTVIVQPVFDSYGENRSVVGLVEGLLSWDTYLKDMLPEGVQGVIGVIENTCNESFSYEIVGHEAIFLGMSDLHDPAFDKHRIKVDFYEFNGGVEYENLGEGQCHYKMYLYPSSEFWEIYESERPELFSAAIAFVFFVTGVTFFIFSYCVDRHQRKLRLSAEKTNTIVKSLFPKNVRDRIMKEVEEHVENETRDPMRHFFKEAPKLKLKSFLHEENEEHDVDYFNTKPIADLFPDVTVLFADLVGFTAWSSVREPSQVFQLLETIYRSFDQLAKRRRVFKVETVGDCYVAACGLPDARKDHAVVMARFARDCMHSVHELTRKLEETLGPDTGDLTLRAGMHSGPVTAGVLRGEKSRFQLFGDTMNTASRIETTGSKDNIHLSQETADLLIASGKAKWVTPREKKVVLKGKGEVNTFWLSVSGGKTGTGSVTSGSDTGSLSLHNVPDTIAVEPKWVGQLVNNNNSSSCDLEGHEKVVLDPKMQRIVKWNVDQLIKLLKPVVATRNCMRRKSNQFLLAEDEPCEFKADPNMTVLEEVQEIIELPKFNAKTFKSIEDPDTIELSSDVVTQLHRFVTQICKMYRQNSFHNFEHASHVTMSVVKLLSRIVAPEDVDYYDNGDDLSTSGNNSTGKMASALHDHTYGITSDPLTQFSVALAALIHDVDHTGVPNAQLIKEDAELAARYRNKSVAEQNSVDLAWDLLMSPNYTALRNAIYSNETELIHFRQLIVNSVMATDIVDKELKNLRNSRWAKAFSDDGDMPKTQQDLDDDRNRKATIVIEHLIQASDVAHTMQHWHVYRKWNERFFFEMYSAYKSGRSEVDPSIMWYKGEIGFFDFYIIPLARKLKDCGVFGVSSDEYLNFALMNRAEWVSKGEEIVEQMLEKVKSELDNDQN